MTDQVVSEAAQAAQENVIQDSAQVPPNLIPITPEQLNMIKSALKDRFNKQYSDFVNGVKGLPVNQHLASVAFQYLDTGYLWFEKAIDGMPVPQMQPVSAPAPQQEAVSQPQEQKSAEAAQEAPAAPVNVADEIPAPCNDPVVTE